VNVLENIREPVK